MGKNVIQISPVIVWALFFFYGNISIAQHTPAGDPEGFWIRCATSLAVPGVHTYDIGIADGFAGSSPQRIAERSTRDFIGGHFPEIVSAIRARSLEPLAGTSFRPDNRPIFLKAIHFDEKIKICSDGRPTIGFQMDYRAGHSEHVFGCVIESEENAEPCFDDVPK